VREIELAERLVGTPAPIPEPVDALRAPQKADLVEILGSLATAYRLAHGGRIRIEFIAERPQLPVQADPVALQRAFRNVLDNAIKYTPDAGEVRIRAGAAGPQAFVVVKDTGMGMSPEERVTSCRHCSLVTVTTSVEPRSSTLVTRSTAAPTAVRQAKATFSGVSGASRSTDASAAGMTCWTGITI